MFKLLACGCFLMGSLGYGYSKVNEYQKRYEELIYIRYILNTLLLETTNHRGTFGENCLSVSSKIKEPYKKMFETMYYVLEKERKHSPYIYWENAIKELASKVLLKREEVRILQGVIKCTDGTTIGMPVEVMRQSLSEWDTVIAEADKVRKEKSKVTLCLSISAGLLLCITIL